MIVAVAFVVVAAGRPDRRPVSRQPGDAVSGLPIRMQIESMIAPESDRWSVLVRSIEGNVVYEHNPDLHLQPASNMKVLTTAAALDALGPGWTTRTSVYATAEPAEDGTVDGSIVLYGRGDPNLSGRLSETGDVLEPFRQLAASVRARGLVRVTGDLVADASYLSGPPHGSGWAWQDLQWHFGTEVSALSFNDNLASINVLPAEAGSSCLVTVTPDVGHVRIQ
ncbi:MAG: D-alanyl-D-alanine carboxypeptidase, partial [Acidobacteria bacterium]|nr:D-alanyl-D-alanine carboxypeptidase [Acidobacteriota bacterium]